MNMTRGQQIAFACDKIDKATAVELAKHIDDVIREMTDAGDRFKAFVHSYLDQHGVPNGDPTNHHQMEGCRIGARLDLLFAERDRYRDALKEIAREEPLGTAGMRLVVYGTEARDLAEKVLAGAKVE